MTSQTKQTKNEFFSSQSSDYSDAIPYDSYVDLRKISIVEENLSKNKNVLDVGCADGLHLPRFATQCNHITGLDYSTDMIASSRQKLDDAGTKNYTLVEASAEEMPLDDNQFDLVYSYSTLVVVNDIDKALSEIARVLKPGGTAIIDMMGSKNLSSHYWENYYQKRCDMGINTFPYKTLCSKMENLGLDTLSSEAIGFTDQWKYMPIIGRAKFIHKLFHSGSGKPDLDSKISNWSILKPYANRWFFKVTKS